MAEDMDSAEEAEREAATVSANLLSCIPEPGPSWRCPLEFLFEWPQSTKVVCIAFPAVIYFLHSDLFTKGSPTCIKSRGDKIGIPDSYVMTVHD